MVDNTPPRKASGVTWDRIIGSDGTVKKIVHDTTSTKYGTTCDNPENGDEYEFYVFGCKGATKLSMWYYKGPDAGTWDLYINDQLDSSGYDEYSSSYDYAFREIDLTEDVPDGVVKFTMKVNGKNASSSGYALYIRNWVVS